MTVFSNDNHDAPVVADSLDAVADRRVAGTVESPQEGDSTVATGDRLAGAGLPAGCLEAFGVCS